MEHSFQVHACTGFLWPCTVCTSLSALVLKQKGTASVQFFTLLPNGTWRLKVLHMMIPQFQNLSPGFNALPSAQSTWTG